MSAAVSVSGLGKSFGKKCALASLDLEVEAGCVFGYIGPNGAGKTTTVKILTGLLDGFEGQARVAGVDVRREPRELKRRIGYLPEVANLYDGLTAFEHLQLVGRLRDMDDARIGEVSEQLLEALGLEGRGHSRLSTYSKGMRQKVLLSAAIMHDPEVLFLDEPLSGLDVGSTMLVKDLVREFANRGKTVFYCSHMMDVVERVCDRIVVLSEGEVVGDGTFEELRESASEDGSLEDVFRVLTHGEVHDDRVQRIMDVVTGRGAA